MQFHKSLNSALAQALADPATILLVHLTHQPKRGISCQLVSPQGFSVNMNTDGDMTACPIDVYQGLFSSSFVCKDHAMVSIQVKETQIDIGPVTSRERVAYTAASLHGIEAKVHPENANPSTVTCQHYADLFKVAFEAPRTALVQIYEAKGN